MQNNYKCSQQDLYAAGRNIATSLENNWSAFQAYSSEYTNDFLTDFRQAIAFAQALPDFQTRDEQTEVARIALAELAKTSLRCWQDLKGKIEKAYKGDLKPRLEAAGSKYYEKASGGSWEALLSLLQNGCTFITNHTFDLTKDGFMLPTLPVAMEECRTQVQAKFDEMKVMEQQNEDATAAKIEANNGIYATASSICSDGFKMFRDDEAKRKLFTFDQVLQVVGGNDLAGIRGHITDVQTTLPVANVQVSDASGQYTTQTNAEGHYQVKAIAAGSYTFSYTKDGYTAITQQVTIHTGITTTVDIALATSSVQVPA